MALLTITSTNPNLSYILEKNPNTIKETGKPFARDIRKGRVYGWFSNEQATQFRLLFLDSPVDNSFSETEFEYLDTSRYASPYAPIAIMTNALDSALKKTSEYDVPDHDTLVTSTIKIPFRILDRFSRANLGAQTTVSYAELANEYHSVYIGSNSVREALNYFQILCFVACLVDKETYIPLKEEALLKYITSLERIDAPYYLRYLVASRAINNRTLFEKLRPQLETESIKLCFGDTQIQRYDAISSRLSGGETLVDIGCGEMWHTLKLTPKYKTIFAVEQDEEQCIQNTGKVKGRGLTDTITPLHAVVDKKWVEENENMFAGADVLVAECLEHMKPLAATGIVRALLKTDANKIVITVPNKSFNTHYGMAKTEFRHPDHLWEPMLEEWLDIVEHWFTGFEEKDWKTTTVGIGDVVDKEPVSLMTVFTKKL